MLETQEAAGDGSLLYPEPAAQKGEGRHWKEKETSSLFRKRSAGCNPLTCLSNPCPITFFLPYCFFCCYPLASIISLGPITHPLYNPSLLPLRLHNFPPDVAVRYCPRLGFITHLSPGVLYPRPSAPLGSYRYRLNCLSCCCAPRLLFCGS